MAMWFIGGVSRTSGRHAPIARFRIEELGVEGLVLPQLQPSHPERKRQSAGATVSGPSWIRSESNADVIHIYSRTEA